MSDITINLLTTKAVAVRAKADGKANIKRLISYIDNEIIKSIAYKVSPKLSNEEICKKLAKVVLNGFIPNTSTPPTLGNLKGAVTGAFDKIKDGLDAEFDTPKRFNDFKEYTKDLGGNIKDGWNTCIERLNDIKNNKSPNTFGEDINEIIETVSGVDVNEIVDDIKSEINKDKIKNFGKEIQDKAKAKKKEMMDAASKLKRGGIPLAELKAKAAQGLCNAALSGNFENSIKNSMQTAIVKKLTGLSKSVTDFLGNTIGNSFPKLSDLIFSDSYELMAEIRSGINTLSLLDKIRFKVILQGLG